MSQDTAPPKLRLDKWLWHARLFKTRGLAAQMVEGGKVRLNSRKINKPAQAVRSGDVLTVTLPGGVRVLRVLGMGTRRGPASEAQQLYEEIP